MEKLYSISGLNIYLQIFFTLLSFSIHIFVTKRKNIKESPIKALLHFTIGLGGWFTIISGFFGHIIYANSVATSIGWPLNSGFQMELGFAAIGIGIVGFIGFWKTEYWLPFIIAKSTFMIGAGITHIIHILKEGNFSPSNTGIVLYWDFIFPIILITLYFFYIKKQKSTSLY